MHLHIFFIIFYFVIGCRAYLETYLLEVKIISKMRKIKEKKDRKKLSFFYPEHPGLGLTKARNLAVSTRLSTAGGSGSAPLLSTAGFPGTLADFGSAPEQPRLLYDLIWVSVSQA